MIENTKKKKKKLEIELYHIFQVLILLLSKKKNDQEWITTLLVGVANLARVYG